MRLEWIEDILAVADAGSLGDAAARRHLTQSAFSRRLRMIEEQIGVELFDRARKPLQLHAPVANEIARMRHLAQSLRELGADLRLGDASAGRVLLISQHALAAALLPGMLDGLRAQNGRVFVHLRSENMQECYNQLLARRVDIAVVYGLAEIASPVYDRLIETQVIGQDRLIPVAAPRLAADLGLGAPEEAPTTPVPGEFAPDLPYIAYPPEVFLGQIMERFLLPEVMSRGAAKPQAETALTLAALEMARQGIGVAWVPQSLAAQAVAEGSLSDLSAHLPAQPLDVLALRLDRAMTGVRAEVWDWITAPKPPR
ncbi:LysR family transcriptional regulator [Paracoccus aminophilus]|uniref:Transcriptional regulator, LysR family n=1 Tax=Paracoccus aminophilus JCM 7686 TaxID=1367847 RepID=S5XTE6_PARAH|nr:LysR substrate-binding domain-containing protein [Paracoccus aminophilus]AGT10774.1 transcriptional regulator, LysR family [Paracoccus aminophilus JCM 7686]